MRQFLRSRRIRLGLRGICSIHRGGTRYVALVTGTQVFHNTADRWPDAVDIAVVARYAKAFATGALELAQQRS
jgi:hypothetical protein